jgi:hypothetical protein
VANRRFGEDGNFADLFWASILDPEANAHALTAIQAEGLRAASELVDRFVRMANPNGNGSDSSSTPPVHPAQGKNSGDVADGAGIEPILRSWLSLTDQFLRGSMQAADDARDGPAMLDLEKAQAQGALDLESAAPGCARAEVWLHNRGAGDLGSVRVRCSELLAHHGHVISSAAIELEPEFVPMPGRSSRGVGVKILVGRDVRPARYCGTLLAEGYPDLSLPVVITIRPPVS